MGLNFAGFEQVTAGLAQGMSFGMQSQKMQMQKDEAAELQKYREVQMEMQKLNTALTMADDLPPAQRGAFLSKHAGNMELSSDFSKSLLTNYGEINAEGQKALGKGIKALTKIAADGDWSGFAVKLDSLRGIVPPSSLAGLEKTAATIAKGTLAPAAAANTEDSLIAQIARQRGGFPGLTPPSYNPGMGVNPYAGGMPGLTPPTGMSDADVLKTPMAGDIRTAANLQKLNLSDKAKENLAFPEWGVTKLEDIPTVGIKTGLLDLDQAIALRDKIKEAPGSKSDKELTTAKYILTDLLPKMLSTSPLSQNQQIMLMVEDTDAFLKKMQTDKTFREKVEDAYAQHPEYKQLFDSAMSVIYKQMDIDPDSLKLTSKKKSKASIGPLLPANKSDAVDAYWAAQFGGK